MKHIQFTSLDVINAANDSGNPLLLKEIDNDIKNAARALLKRGFLKIPVTDLKKLVDDLVESSAISIEQYDQMTSLLTYSDTGANRVTQFVRKRGLFQVSQ